MTLVLRYAARSDRGLVRSNNEDSVYAGARLLALADGMGGHAAGEVASQLVIAALAHLDDDEPGGDLLAKLDEAVHAGNAAQAWQVVAGRGRIFGFGAHPGRATARRSAAGPGPGGFSLLPGGRPRRAGVIAVGAGHGRNSIAVLPIRIGVPIGTRTAVVTFALSR